MILPSLEADVGPSLGAGISTLARDSLFIVLTCVTRVVVMRLILALFVLELMLVLVYGILVALFEGEITLWSVHRAMFECLVAAIRKSLVLLFLLVLVIDVAAIAVVAIDKPRSYFEVDE